MAKNTPKEYRNQILYSVFVRNHTPEGTFEGVRRDLDRIRDLGTDVVWLMPIHPVGEARRKGTLGSPYAIRDYRAVNPEFGDMDDFERLVDGIHARGMRCIIDVVYNHTSPDSWLAEHHPEWFYRRPDGSFGNRVGDWSDVIDLDYSNPGLWDYQIETLKGWASIVDGFRCDVAPLVPLDFWLRARAEVERVRPGCLWLAESVEPRFIAWCRGQGMDALSDSELYQAFDLCYDYDVVDDYRAYLAGQAPLDQYAAALCRQETAYPGNYVKLRFLENHDNPRVAFAIPGAKARRNWTAFLYFQKGMTLLYGGQEVSASHRPDLFEKDPVDWTGGEDISPALRRLAALKRDPILTDGGYTVRALARDVLYAVHRADAGTLAGVFSLRGEPVLAEVDVPDGVYPNLAGGGSVEVYAGKVSCQGEPVIVRAPKVKTNLTF